MRLTFPVRRTLVSLALLGATQAGTAMAAPSAQLPAMPPQGMPGAATRANPTSPALASPALTSPSGPGRGDPARIESGRVQPPGADPARIVSAFGEPARAPAAPPLPPAPTAPATTPAMTPAFGSATSPTMPRPAAQITPLPSAPLPPSSVPPTPMPNVTTPSVSVSPAPTMSAPMPSAPVQAMATGSASIAAAGADRAETRRGDAAVRVGLEHVGAPYRFGGASPAGFDCSGFVTYVYGRAGFDLPRDLAGQLGRGRRVERDGLEPGDLVFFRDTYKSGLSHSGVYVGDGRFVHAAAERKGVVVSALAQGYWSARYVGASRPDR